MHLLRTPSAYWNDPWGFARNQVAHGYIIGGGGALMLSPWAWWAILPIYALWEFVQIENYRARPWDSVEDFANVAVIAFAVARPDAWAFFAAVHALFLLSGWLRRRQNA
jgi:hypothetical protein